MNRNKYIQEIDKVFKDFIRTDEERVLFERTYQVHELKKGEIFLKKGDPWYKFGFILEGSIYSFYYDDNGEKSIVEFYYFPQNYNVADYETYLNETEVALWYECFEDSALLLFDGRKFNEYYDDIPGIHKYRLNLAENRYFKALNVIKILQSTNADDKVQELLNQSPEIFKIFPYSYIASYLGMHRNTFRRVLKKFKI